MATPSEEEEEAGEVTDDHHHIFGRGSSLLTMNPSSLARFAAPSTHLVGTERELEIHLTLLLMMQMRN